MQVEKRDTLPTVLTAVVYCRNQESRYLHQWE